MGALLGDRIPFRIPVYQRGYAWQTDEIEDFTNDIRSLLSDGDATHFFGGILSVRETAPETRTGNVYELVDGQQRATTFTLLIHAVVSAYADVAAEAAAAGDEATEQRANTLHRLKSADFLTYEELEPPPGTGTVPRLRLQLSRRDDSFFQRLLEGSAPNVNRRSPHSHRLLARALEDLRSELVDGIINNEDSSPAQKLADLDALLTALSERCYVIHITTDDRNEAYSLFTVLNDRGRSLSDGDLLRTRTLELLEGHPDLQEQAEQEWDSILKGTPTEVRGFLRAFFASHEGIRWPSKDLHKVMWDTYFETTGRGIAGATRVLDTIREFGVEHGYYQAIQSGIWPYEDGDTSAWYKQRLWRLVKVLRGQASVPLLLSIRITQDEEFFATVVSLLERFTLRYNMVGGHASQLGDRYYAESTIVRTTPDYTLAHLEETLGSQLARYGSDDLFKSSLAERINYRRSPIPLIRHFLTTLDDYEPWLRAGASGPPTPDTIATFDLQAIQIEHIYPQRPRERIPALNSLVHDLGNLTFWAPDDNRSASNAPFSEKRPKYLASRVDMTKAVGANEEWTPEVLRARQELLLEKAAKVFSFKLPAPTRVVSPETGVVAWFVQQNPDSRYRDREGEVYDYPYSIPNAQQIVPADVLVCYRAQRVSTEDERIFGVGRVGTVVPDGDRLLAVYDRYLGLEPPLSFADIGGDPRNNRRNAINQTEPRVIEQLMSLTGLDTLDDAAIVNADLDDLIQLGVDQPDDASEDSV